MFGWNIANPKGKLWEKNNLYQKNIEPKDGYITVPEDPGLGNEISDYCFETGKVISIE